MRVNRLSVPLHYVFPTGILLPYLIMFIVLDIVYGIIEATPLSIVQ
jgi:hypothetical protein